MRDLSKLADEDLVAMYAKAAFEHGLASEVGNYRKANASYDLISAAFRELRRRGAGALELLLPLLADERISVRVWAGAHALQFSPEQGTSVLEEIAKGPNGLHGFNAEMTLKEWRKGNLSFP